jgi:hypothetical protein
MKADGWCVWLGMFPNYSTTFYVAISIKVK